MRNININMLHMKLNSAVSVFAVAAAFSVLLPPLANPVLAAPFNLNIPVEQRGLLGIELTNDASAARLAGVCFLPDCQDSDTMHGDVNMNVNNDTEWCEKKGYIYYATGKCPQYYAEVGKCSRDDHYLKCDAKTWCQQNGYNTTTCSIPNYVDQPCPSFGTLYKGCKRDNQRACKDTGYTNSCPSGQKLHASGRCSYDNNFGTCCRPSGCPSNTSLSYSSYGANGSDGCGYTCYYTCNPNCPSGTSTSNPGGCGGSTKNGCRTKTCYYPYEACCSPYSNETGCSCGTYSCSDGCSGTRTCCSSCPDPEPTTPPSSGSGGGTSYNPDDCKPGTTTGWQEASCAGWCDTDWGNPDLGQYIVCEKRKYCTTYAGNSKQVDTTWYFADGPWPTYEECTQNRTAYNRCGGC